MDVGGEEAIVAESCGGPGEVSATARRHGLSGGQLFTWRRLARDGRLGDELPALVPVEIAKLPANETRTAEERIRDEVTALAPTSKRTGSILIEVGNGRCIRLDGDFDPEALERVLDVLDRRR